MLSNSSFSTPRPNRIGQVQSQLQNMRPSYCHGFTRLPCRTISKWHETHTVKSPNRQKAAQKGWVVVEIEMEGEREGERNSWWWRCCLEME